LDRLAGLGGDTSRRVFGGAGAYCDEYFFGLIADDGLCVRVDDSTATTFSLRGMTQSVPRRPHTA
jgi:TfoX/Sxy family transcriptional regulator of competence genes